MNKKNKILITIFGFILMATLVLANTTVIRDTVSDFFGINNTGNFITTDPYIDVRAYGAIADDGIDDMFAFQQIADNYATNFTVYIPCGRFDLQGKWNFTSSHQRVNIICEGWCSELYRMDGSDDEMIRFDGSDYITIKNCNLNGNIANNDNNKSAIGSGANSNYHQYLNMYIHDVGTGIYNQQGRNILIDGNYFQNIGDASVSTSTHGMGIYLFSSSYSRIVNNLIDTFYGDGGIFFADSGNKKMRYFTISDNVIINGVHDQSSGIHLYEARYGTISGNTINTATNLTNSDDHFDGINGIFVRTNAGDTEGWITISNNQMNVSGVGVEVGTAYVNVIGNNIYGNNNGTDANGIYIGANNVIINGNLIHNVAQHGIYVDNKNNTIITNNLIKGAGQSGTGSGIRMVQNVNTEHYVISGNQIYNNTNYGIYRNGGGSLDFTTVQFYGNDIYDNPDGNVLGIYGNFTIYNTTSDAFSCGIVAGSIVCNPA